MRLAPVALLLLAAGCAHGVGPAATRDTPPAVTATTQLLSADGQFRGTATLTQRGTATRVEAHVEGLPAGTYAIHLHSIGKCEGPKFASAGGHFNPTMKMHGRDNPVGPHLGDLPNVVVGKDGKGMVDFTVAGLALTGGATPLLDADGAAVVVHAGPDDYKTDPSGNSGDRIACGTLAAR